jgi:hypothetical protein
VSRVPLDLWDWKPGQWNLGHHCSPDFRSSRSSVLQAKWRGWEAQRWRCPRERPRALQASIPDRVWDSALDREDGSPWCTKLLKVLNGQKGKKGLTWSTRDFAAGWIYKGWHLPVNHPVDLRRDTLHLASL